MGYRRKNKNHFREPMGDVCRCFLQTAGTQDVLAVTICRAKEVVVEVVGSVRVTVCVVTVVVTLSQVTWKLFAKDSLHVLMQFFCRPCRCNFSMTALCLIAYSNSSSNANFPALD